MRGPHGSPDARRRRGCVVPLTTARRAALALPIAIIDLKGDWAIRELTICVRDLDEAAPYARELVSALRA